MLFASLDTAVNFKKVLQFGQIINNSRCRHPLLGSLQENLLLEVWLSDGPSVVIALHPLHFTTQPLPLNPAYSQATTEHRRGSRGRPAPHPIMCDFSNRELLLKDSPTACARLPQSCPAAQASSQFSSHCLFLSEVSPPPAGVC